MTTNLSVPAGLESVAVVVVNYGSSDLLETNLVASGLDAGVSVVIVDNFTSDQERAQLRRLAAARGWTLVEMEQNVGFGAGMNAGVAAARALGHDVFLLLNPDATISAEGLVRLVAGVRLEPMTLISPVIARPDGSAWFRGAWVDVEHGRTRQTTSLGPGITHPWLVGTCLVVHATLWDAIGGFDEAYFLYWEDVDLSWRCAAAGAALVLRTDVTAVHSVGGTQGTSGKSPTYYYWNCRNRLLFAAEHLPRRDVLRWALRTPRYARQVLLRGGRRQLLRPIRPVSAAVRGSAAGLVLAGRALIRQPNLATKGASL